MAMQEQKKTVYRSMQGKEVDMNRLFMQNELTVAVGNVKVNARGDELGPGGRIIKKREEVLREASLPDENNIRQVETPLVVKKDVKDMDPEGNE